MWESGLKPIPCVLRLPDCKAILGGGEEGDGEGGAKVSELYLGPGRTPNAFYTDDAK